MNCPQGKAGTAANLKLGPREMGIVCKGKGTKLGRTRPTDQDCPRRHLAVRDSVWLGRDLLVVLCCVLLLSPWSLARAAQPCPEQTTHARARKAETTVPKQTARGVNPAPSPGDAQPPEPETSSENLDRGAPETSAERTTVNLLGEVDTLAGEARRNENVSIFLIDNNVLKELNVRMGTTATIIHEFRVDHDYFGSEFGGPPKAPLHLPPSRVRRVHGDFYWSHNNSIFSARSFFQVGDVQPARSNDYGFSLGIPLWEGASLTVNASQRKLRGQVNGNVLVPKADERTSLSNDPATRAMVERILAAYPDELPNRTDRNPRLLNTNAPQTIDNDRVGGVLDQAWGDKDRLSLRYNLIFQNVEAFQLVGGQNPDTTTKNHRARITWNRTWPPSTTTDFSIGFDRIGSLLVPEETSIGPSIWAGGALQFLGPTSRVPIDRAQNAFRYAGRVQQNRGRHTWYAGFQLLRRQINGVESWRHRGLFSFGNDFGRDQIENLRMGTPSSYTVALGNVHRGFRNWDMEYFVGEAWRVNRKLTLNLGLRYQPVTKPSEVNGLSNIPYDCDCNNWAPRFGFAYRLSDRWGVLRAAYGVQYGEIFPVTFGQARFNPPTNLLVSVDVPDLIDPLKDLQPSDLDPTARSSIFQLDPNLVSPYSHQYNFSWELRFAREWKLSLGYVGSRSHRLLTTWSLNRARLVDGIPQTTSTINERRPDQRFFEVRRILNGSRGYFDAGKVRFTLPHWRGLTLDASYWFSKAIDLGAGYISTGSNAFRSRSPSGFDYQGEMKGLSSFDQPHALLWRVNYETPPRPMQSGWIGRILGQWQISSIILLKSGTPFRVRTGSDAPGFGNVDGAGNDNPILLDPSILGRTIDSPDTSQEMLPPSAFSFIEPTDLRGNLGRNTFRKDGIWNVNAGLSRRWSLGGDKSLLFRAESINFLNHPQFSAPGRQLTTDHFGQITRTLNDGRAFRFTMRFSF